MKSMICKIAHEAKAHTESFSVAMKLAWILVRLYAHFPQEITFAKSTGEVRTAKAVFVPHLQDVKSGFVKFVEETADGVQQWRSFRIERLILN